MKKNPYNLSVTKIVGRVKELAAAKPNTVYQGVNDHATRDATSCYYAAGSAGGRVGCIFGQALFDLGVPRKVLKEMDENVLAIDVALRQLGVPVSNIQEEVVTKIQLDQDHGCEWGELHIDDIERNARKAYRQ